MKRKTGVTVVELIIVLVIVAVTAAILFPVFAKPRDGHRDASCASNLRQVGFGVMQYIQDYDEVFPPRQTHATTHGELVSWRFLVNPYVKNTSLYQCPDNPAARVSDIEHDGFKRSYAVNATTVTKYGSSGPFSDVHAGKFKVDSISLQNALIMITETSAAFNDVNITFPEGFTSAFAPSRNTGALYAGHSGYSNYLFADGHVKALRPLQTLNVDGRNLWTSDNSMFSDQERANATRVLQYAVDRNSNHQN